MGQESGDWRELVSEWKTSGESQAEFCRARKLNLKRFYYWKSRYAGDAQSSFIAIGRGEESKAIELVSPSGVRILLPIDVSEQRLAEVVRCLS